LAVGTASSESNATIVQEHARQLLQQTKPGAAPTDWKSQSQVPAAGFCADSFTVTVVLGAGGGGFLVGGGSLLVVNCAATVVGGLGFVVGLGLGGLGFGTDAAAALIALAGGGPPVAFAAEAEVAFFSAQASRRGGTRGGIVSRAKPQPMASLRSQCKPISVAQAPPLAGRACRWQPTHLGPAPRWT
jgi:hypothetical protein